MFDLQFHAGDQQHVVKPNELQIEKKHYPPVIDNDSVLNRIQGSIFGLAIGDAIGAPVKLKPYAYLMTHPTKDFDAGGIYGLQKGQVIK